MTYITDEQLMRLDEFDFFKNSSTIKLLGDSILIT